MPVPSPYSPRVPNSWTAVTVTADAEVADSLGAFLIDHGAPGLVSEDLPNAVRITAHFEYEAPRAELADFCARLREWFPGIGAGTGLICDDHRGELGRQLERTFSAPRDR